MADEKPNLKVLVPILISGKHQDIGAVVPKTAFAVKGDWQNLVFGFDPPRLAETAEAVGKPGKAEKAAAALPGAGA